MKRRISITYIMALFIGGTMGSTGRSPRDGFRVSFAFCDVAVNGAHQTVSAAGLDVMPALASIALHGNIPRCKHRGFIRAARSSGSS
jgi:hypothetical protein